MFYAEEKEGSPEMLPAFLPGRHLTCGSHSEMINNLARYVIHYTNT